MRPIRLTIQAFESYGKKTTIDFTKPNQNLFLITGDTGAGKTTIFDAIVFALYGEASSSVNRKDGIELQSQFAPLEMEPYVELVFMEQNNTYCVRRVPRHIRPAKRKGAADQEVSESVTLTMPDGSDYPQKEADRKLVEIVGLTKEQFMQVAMIAQGEFMDLLRADSNRKKEIFRKLFHTELYQNIVDELDRRRKEKLGTIGQIRTACQQEVSHISIPESFPDSEEMTALRQRLLSSDRLNIAEMEELLRKLDELCTFLDTKRKQAEKDVSAAGKARDAARDACTAAQTLVKSFDQLQSAAQTLADLDTEESAIREKERLTRRIRDAFDIKATHDRLSDAVRERNDTAANLEKQEAALPGLAAAADGAAGQENAAKEAADHALSSWTTISERTSKALDILKKIKDADRNAAAKAEAAAAAGKASDEAAKALADFEEQERNWRKRADELSDSGTLLRDWESRRHEAGEIRKDLNTVRSFETEMTAQKETAQAAAAAYQKAKSDYEQKRAEYEQSSAAFLDAQAGFLAQTLEDGKPCPVCGSTRHPHPAVLTEILTGSRRELTRDTIRQLSDEAAQLEQKRTDAAQASGSAADVLKEKQEHYAQALAQLQARLAAAGQGAAPADRQSDSLPSLFNHPGPAGTEQNIENSAEAEALLSSWEAELAEEGKKRKADADELENIQQSLRGSDAQKTQLRAQRDDAAAAAAEAQNQLISAQTALDGLKAQVGEYPTEDAARDAEKAARKEKESADRTYKEALAASRKAKTAREQAETLITRYRQELPLREDAIQKRRTDYESLTVQKDLAESEWQQLAGQHQLEEADIFQKEVNAHDRKRAAAQGALQAAQEAVSGRERPDLPALDEARDEAQKKLDGLQKEQSALNELYKTNHDALQALSPKMEERAAAMEEFTRIDSLYGRLAGKKTGARMDIETYVQRYYLQRILYAANVRFRDMSAGQFELRMTSEDQAGAGKNRGLDLMVWSAVTGKDREVRTLSGGESFMAALSLALGMADQIQESSSAIHLDMMFIDEGFGSLDDHARDQAVRVLQRMAAGSRLIGIISHVTELRQQIEDQLLVRKDQDGSHVEWQIS